MLYEYGIGSALRWFPKRPRRGRRNGTGAPSGS
jgi:hypothetical protein